MNIGYMETSWICGQEILQMECGRHSLTSLFIHHKKQRLKHHPIALIQRNPIFIFLPWYKLSFTHFYSLGTYSFFWIS